MPLNTFVENAWYVAGRSAEFPLNEPKGLKIAGRPGLVWVWPGDPAKIGEQVPPPTPELAGGKWINHMFDPKHVPANYVLLIENLMDITHFYPLHDGNIGDIEQSKIPIEVVEERLYGCDTVKTVRNAKNYKQPPFYADWFGYPVVDRWHTHHMVSPGLTRVELRVAPPGKLGVASEERGYVIYHSHTPIDGTNHTWR